MKKSELKYFVVNNKTISYQNLKDMVCNIKEKNRTSVINNGLPRKYLIDDIFMPYFDELIEKGQNMDEIVQTTSYNSKTSKIQINVNGLIMKNILKECEFKL